MNISVVPILNFAYNSDTDVIGNLNCLYLYLYLYIHVFTPFSSICSCVSLMFSTALYSHFCWKMKLTNY